MESLTAELANAVDGCGVCRDVTGFVTIEADDVDEGREVRSEELDQEPRVEVACVQTRHDDETNTEATRRVEREETDLSERFCDLQHASFAHHPSSESRGVARVVQACKTG